MADARDFGFGGGSLYPALQAVAEVLIGIYVADLISGVVHLYLDYQEIKDQKWRLHVETSIPAVEKVRIRKVLSASKITRFPVGLASHVTSH